jgi:hypothetical protein
MYIKNAVLKASVILGIAVFVISCKKDDKITTHPTVAEFVNPTGNMLSTFYVKNDPNAQIKIPVGITNVTNSSETIQFSYASPTGAVQGTNYSAPASITIPAGKALDSLTIKGMFAAYATGRKDTLVITISGGDVPANAYNNVYKLVLNRYCDVVAANLTGSYANSIDYYNNAPSATKYTATITNWVSTGSTSATANIVNLGATPDNGWGPFASTDAAKNPGVQVKLDWSNPASFTVTVPTQNYFNDGTGNSTITGSGSFSSCDNTFTIKFTVKYAGNGSSYTTTAVLNR